jgi:phosphoribosyl 1,2-cyclic phosphodiesterase
MRAALVTALRGVDTVVYDTHYLPEEYERFPHYGHSTPDHALELCGEAGVKRLVLYHHAPSHNDDQMDQIAMSYAVRGRRARHRGGDLARGHVAADRGGVVKLRYWGARGSFAMCGRDFLRYGGNTTSVELVTSRGGRLLIDLGTGATELAKLLMTVEFGQGRGHLPVLLSHTHLDHIQGLPFFTPFFVKGNQIRILGANPAGTSLEATLQNQLQPHYSPLNGLENLAAGVSIEAFVPGQTLQVDDFRSPPPRCRTAACGPPPSASAPRARRSPSCPTSSTRRPTSRPPRRWRWRAAPTC